jgi:hypothetical protein
MPTTVTSTIGTASRDYSTIQAWEDACPASLTAVDQVWRGECYNDNEFLETSAFALLFLGGITSDATRYVELTAAAGESFQDHADVRTNPLRYDQAKGVGLRKTSNYLGVIDVDISAFKVSRLQIKCDGAGRAINDSGDSGELVSRSLQTIQDCILDGTSANVVNLGAPTLINCVCIYRGTTGNAINGHVYLECFGCTVIQPIDILPVSGAAFGANYNTNSVLVSCAAFGFTTFVSNEARFDALVCKNNASDLSSGVVGSNNQTSVTFTQTTPFTDADKDSLDLRAIAGTALISNGFFDADYPDDISGLTRVDPPTIGAWEVYVEPVVGTPARIIIKKA